LNRPSRPQPLTTGRPFVCPNLDGFLVCLYRPSFFTSFLGGFVARVILLTLFIQIRRVFRFLFPGVFERPSKWPERNSPSPLLFCFSLERFVSPAPVTQLFSFFPFHRDFFVVFSITVFVTPGKANLISYPSPVWEPAFVGICHRSCPFCFLSPAFATHLRIRLSFVKRPPQLFWPPSNHLRDSFFFALDHVTKQ